MEPHDAGDAPPATDERAGGGEPEPISTKTAVDGPGRDAKETSKSSKDDAEEAIRKAEQFMEEKRTEAATQAAPAASTVTESNAASAAASVITESKGVEQSKAGPSLEKSTSAPAPNTTNLPAVPEAETVENNIDSQNEKDVEVVETLNSTLVLSLMDKDKRDGGDDGVVSQIFGPSVGPVLAEYACSHDNKRGTIYLATKAACFYSPGFLGFQQARVVIPLATIAAIVHLGNDGISVKTDSRKTFAFVGMDKHRDAAFNLLLSLHGRVSIYKSNSLPADEAPADEEAHQSMTDSMKFRRTLSAPVASLLAEVEKQTDVPTEDDYLAACAVANMAETAQDSTRKLVSEIERGKISDHGRATAKKYGAKEESFPTDLSKAWAEIRDAKEPSFNEVVISQLKLPCGLDDFFETFLSNDAKQSIAVYQHEKVGDIDHKVTPWQLSEDGEFSLSRTVSYVHPVTAPMAPPKAAASKEQSFRRFGEHGMCVDTRTIVKDVPMVDCFHVDDQLLLEPMPEGGISLTARFEIRFIKRTMFRSIITNTTKSEFINWFQGYRKMVLETLKDKRAVEVEVEEEDEKEGVEVVTEATVEEGKMLAPIGLSPVVEKYLLSLVGLVALLVMMQFMLMLQVRAANNAFMHMSAKQDKVFYLIMQILDSKIGVTANSCSAGEE